VEVNLQELIEQIAKGNERCFNQLFTLYKDKVFNTALSYLHNAADAEEATQDVFIEIYQSASKFEGKSKVGTWIYRITVNKCLDRLRYQKRKKRFAFVVSIFKQGTGELQHDYAHFDHPGVKLESKEDAAVLFKAIDTLPENQKTAFILSQIEELSQKEIAEVMNASIKAIESLIQRAKGNLRKELADFYLKAEGKELNKRQKG
jgi:RNA polymerase sigma-70 factor (family 1)